MLPLVECQVIRHAKELSKHNCRALAINAVFVHGLDILFDTALIGRDDHDFDLVIGFHRVLQ